MINRKKWEVEGAEITAEMIARLKEPPATHEHHHVPPKMDVIVEDSGFDTDSIVLANEDLDDDPIDMVEC